MGDERDETLSGYDSLIRSFELEPPDGFSSMDDFNAELNGWLDRVHPDTREYLDQSLRGGTQTPDQLFGKGHVLVEKIRARIDEAVARYIAEMREDDRHPFLSRRAKGFPLFRLLVVTPARLRLSRQSYPSPGLDQLLLLRRRAQGGGRCKSSGRAGSSSASPASMCR